MSQVAAALTGVSILVCVMVDMMLVATVGNGSRNDLIVFKSE